ncbi:sensor histidine kinase [Flavobacteriaceae bacterium R38]|nr:sensor histidine kinase [Flavobacteriaceae bacterium R38]
MLKQYFIYISFFLFFLTGFSQIDKSNAFTIKGTVKGEEFSVPVSDVDVYVIGGAATKTDYLGRFELDVRIGDRLVFSSIELETIIHTITNDEDIDVLVRGYQESKISKIRIAKRIQEGHRKFIDSANYYKKSDIESSIDLIEKSLIIIGGDKRENKKRALSFSTLGDIYLYWKQYDLAIDNYQNAIKTNSTIPVRIQLGKTYFLNKQYEESKTVFEALNKQRKLSSFQQITILSGLGDAFKELKDFYNSILNYNEALKIAQDNLVTPKITDLNSKLAEVYAKTDSVDKAQGFYSNSLNLAEKENPKRAIQERSKVADFLNKKNLYDKEIELRKSTLEEVKKFKAENDENVEDVVGVLTDTITSQKINYKIGDAFVAQDKFEEAIPYLEESIAEADKEEDLVVQKDATRKLSEVYRSVGDYTKALETYQDYVELVDQLYIKKEQEISQLTRFSRDIALKQSRITSLEKDRELTETLALKDQELIKESNKRQRIIIYSLIFGILMITLVAFLFYRTNKQQHLANNLLALKSLRSQMNPHFIFNALNSVNNFIAKSDERSANEYLSKFSTLMRSVLENSEENFIPLQKEIELLELYTKLEHSRFKEKFDYEIKVDENLEMDAFGIPPMLLQPYVENAIWHGLRYKEDKGWLKIYFYQPNNEYVKITIEDNGVGRKQSGLLKTENQRKQKSKGMGNIKKRVAILNDMYKDRIDIYIQDMFEDETGTRVVLTLKRD